MKLFKCQACGQLLYFENRTCERCGHRLGYLHETGTLSGLERNGTGTWRALALGEGSHRFCSNAEFDACNWLVPATSDEAYCTACRHPPRICFDNSCYPWDGLGMPNDQTRNVSLTAELNAFISAQVASGHYQNASEVVRAGLRLLAQHAEREALPTLPRPDGALRSRAAVRGRHARQG